MSMINGNEIGKEDFIKNVDEPGCFLTKSGIKKYVSKLEKKLKTEVKYLDYITYSVSFKRAILLQVEQLVKAIEQEDSVFVLIIYDIEKNKKRIKLAKHLQGYGFRVQKSAFEATISKNKYDRLLNELPRFIDSNDNDSIRIYKIIGKGQVTFLGQTEDNNLDDIIVI